MIDANGIRGVILEDDGPTFDLKGREFRMGLAWFVRRGSRLHGPLASFNEGRAELVRLMSVTRS